MWDEAWLAKETEKIVELLFMGQNVWFIGQNQELIQRLIAAAALQLEEHTRVHHFPTQSESQFDKVDPRATHIVAQSLSPQQAFELMTQHPHVNVLASIRVAHEFGVAFVWARLLQEEFGDKSALPSTLLAHALKSIRCVGVSNSPPALNGSGTFREKLMEARYNQKKSVVADHGSLLKGWTREGEACDPGWELDK